MLKLCPTRWLARGGATERVLDNYQALVEEFKQDPSAQNLYQIMTSQRVVSSLVHVVDLLVQQATMSKVFQATVVNYGQVKRTIGAVGMRLVPGAATPYKMG